MLRAATFSFVCIIRSYRTNEQTGSVLQLIAWASRWNEMGNARTMSKNHTPYGNVRVPNLKKARNVIRIFLGRTRRFRRTVSHIIATGLTIQEQAGKHRFLWAYLGTCTSSLSWVFPCTFCHRRTEEGRCTCESCTFGIYGRVWCTCHKHSSLTSLRWPLRQRK